MDNKKSFDPNDVGRTFKGKEGIIFTVLKYDPHMEAVHAHNEETGTDWAFPVERFYQDFEPCMNIKNLGEIPLHMSREEMAKVMDSVIIQMNEFREAGQREYARREDNAFGNFERVAERLKISREKVLLVYLEKHLDGIHSYCDGHTSQRENVKGRIMDAIVYLTLLYGMVEHNEKLEGEIQTVEVSDLTTRSFQ